MINTSIKLITFRCSVGKLTPMWSFSQESLARNVEDIFSLNIFFIALHVVWQRMIKLLNYLIYIRTIISSLINTTSFLLPIQSEATVVHIRSLCLGDLIRFVGTIFILVLF